MLSASQQTATMLGEEYLHNIFKINTKLKRLIHGAEATGGVFTGDRVTNQFTELLIISHIVR